MPDMSTIFWCVALLGAPLVIILLAAVFVGSKADDDMARYMEERRDE